MLSDTVRGPVVRSGPGGKSVTDACPPSGVSRSGADRVSLVSVAGLAFGRASCVASRVGVGSGVPGADEGLVVAWGRVPLVLDADIAYCRAAAMIGCSFGVATASRMEEASPPVDSTRRATRWSIAATSAGLRPPRSITVWRTLPPRVAAGYQMFATCGAGTSPTRTAISPNSRSRSVGSAGMGFFIVESSRGRL